MTKPIRSFPVTAQFAVAQKRANSTTVGLGQLSAKAFLERKAVAERLAKVEKDLKAVKA